MRAAGNTEGRDVNPRGSRERQCGAVERTLLLWVRQPWVSYFTSPGLSFLTYTTVITEHLSCSKHESSWPGHRAYKPGVFPSSCLKSQSLWASLVALHSACYPHLLDCWVLWGRDCLFFTFHLYQPVQLRAETESLWMAVTLGCIQLCRGIYNNARCLEKSWEIWKEAEKSKESLVLCHLVTYH